MEQHEDSAVLVHCAYNWRVSCFIYLYRIIKLNCDDETAQKDMLSLWQPNEVWQEFISHCIKNKGSLE